MAAEANQDFITYQGDDVAPVFTVRDGSGAIVNISSVSNITWIARRNLQDAAVLTKTKAGGEITFVTDGTDGQFQVEIDAADTTALSGYYVHQASITDANGNITTVTVGRMQVGLPPAWTYDATQLATSTLYQVRRLVGDVLVGDQQLTDPEVLQAINLWPGSIYLAAAECCRNIAAQYSRRPDLVQGELKTNYSQLAKAYMDRAAEMESRGNMIAGAMPYAGGIDVDDKNAVAADPNRVPPAFNIGMDDNLQYPGPFPNQVPDASEVS